jgi:hypothetical protein
VLCLAVYQFNWSIFAIDGANLTTYQQIIKPALKQSVTVGQKTDFEFNAGKPGNYLFAVKDYLDSTVLKNVLKVN